MITIMDLYKQLEEAKQARVDALLWCREHEDELAFGVGPDMMGFDCDIRYLESQIAELEKENE